MAWSHYMPGDERCDVIPTLREITREFRCPSCGQHVMYEEEAAARRLLPFRLPESKPPDIQGFVWAGEFYVRIAERDPRDVAAELSRASRKAFERNPEWRRR